MQNNTPIECPLCSGDTTLVENAIPGFIEPEVFQIYRCNSCQSGFSFPRNGDTKELYEIIYKKGAEIPGYARYWKYAEDVKSQKEPLEYLASVEDVYWSVREALNQTIGLKKSAKILEIGSGLGYLTYALRKSGYDCVGLDLSETAVKRANQQYGNYFICENIYTFAEKEPESYDIILLTEVIEHINDPLHFMTSVWKLVKPHGCVILTTPNKSFFPSEVSWYGDFPPVHIWIFSESSIVYIADRLKAKVTFIDFSAFHKNHYTCIDIAKVRKRPQLPPVLNLSGNVNQVWEQKKSWRVDRMQRNHLLRVPHLRKILLQLIGIFNPGLVVGGKRGPIMCAIFEKFD